MGDWAANARAVRATRHTVRLAFSASLTSALSDGLADRLLNRREGVGENLAPVIGLIPVSRML